PTPTVALVTPAAGCPTISNTSGPGTLLTDSGTISGPTGTYRVCTLPARIIAPTAPNGTIPSVTVTLPRLAGVLYQMNGRVDVGNDQGATTTGTTNVVLAIEPGVILFAGTGTSWLAVNRGNSIQAVGTPTQPIIFTSRDNIQGLNTETSTGQWGGVVLLGRAQTTDCSASAATPGTTACERQTEGAIDPAVYGGANNTESSGRISFVQIRYSGFVLSGNSELQSLTTSSIGSGTVLNNIMSYNSSDDGAEFFGGRVNMRFFISVGAEDDNLDTDTGVKANFQYVLIAQRAGTESRGTDAIIEADSDNAVDGNLPRQNTIVSNFTFLHRVNNASASAAILLRGGTDYSLLNGFVLATPSPSCLRISRANTAATTASLGVNATNQNVAGAATGNDELGAPVFRSVQMQCGATPFSGINSVTAADVMSIFGAGANGNSATYTPSFTNTFINGATETAVPAFDPSNVHAASGQPTLALNRGGQPQFFDAVTFAGAVRNAADTWYTQWTCNSTALNLGTNTGLCTSLPTF
ncbi:hypothetical protein, partial [Sphingomonas sp.]|uniref:hypothetical protein n=1 Tax=Sphingomonas sp. TaxID=28214 RepID=UPI0035A8F5FF